MVRLLKLLKKYLFSIVKVVMLRQIRIIKVEPGIIMTLHRKILSFLRPLAWCCDVKLVKTPLLLFPYGGLVEINRGVVDRNLVFDRNGLSHFSIQVSTPIWAFDIILVNYMDLWFLKYVESHVFNHNTVEFTVIKVAADIYFTVVWGLKSLFDRL